MSPFSHDVVDTMARQLKQLDALLCVATSEAFTTQSDRVQQYFLWACSELASSALDTLLNEAVTTEVQV
jgi:hypothetical protein